MALSEEKTESYYSWSGIHHFASDRDPVVGWLVCVDGAHIGTSFTLHAGKNFIGRDSSMDIVLSEDASVSRQKHAVIVFEPKKRQFFVMPGESRQPFYLNRQIVLSGISLKARDNLQIGNSRLVFIPFCDESFGWDTTDYD